MTEGSKGNKYGTILRNSNLIRDSFLIGEIISPAINCSTNNMLKAREADSKMMAIKLIKNKKDFI